VSGPPVTLFKKTQTLRVRSHNHPMTPTDLRALPATEAATLSPLLHALWHDAHGDWDRAHSIAQYIHTADAARVHAYLHRKEGDGWNAGYWYRRAGRPVFTGSLDDEWTALATHLLIR
jgi:hypothetical protein